MPFKNLDGNQHNMFCSPCVLKVVIFSLQTVLKKKYPFTDISLSFETNEQWL